MNRKTWHTHEDRKADVELKVYGLPRVVPKKSRVGKWKSAKSQGKVA
jgi:hypothetical protein